MLHTLPSRPPKVPQQYGRCRPLKTHSLHWRRQDNSTVCSAVSSQRCGRQTSTWVPCGTVSRCCYVCPRPALATDDIHTSSSSTCSVNTSRRSVVAPSSASGVATDLGSRRAGLLALSLALGAAVGLPVPPGVAAASTTTSAPSWAGSLLGAPFHGVATFWRSRQRANGGAKLLAPLKVSQIRLREAGNMLERSTGHRGNYASSSGGEEQSGRVAWIGGNGVMAAARAAIGGNVSDGNVGNEGDLALDATSLTRVLHAVRASSLNCYIFEAEPEDGLETRASLLAQQWRLADPCTFRIIVKSVTQLEGPETRARGQERVEALVRSYQKLDSYLEMARLGNSEALPKAAVQLQTTLDTAAQVEDFVRTVLRVA